MQKKQLTTGAGYGTTQQPDKLHQIRSAFTKSTSTNPIQVTGKSVFLNDLRWRYKPDSFAKGLMKDTFPGWLTDRLRTQATEALRGMDEDMALEVVYDLMDCWTYGVRHYIGIEHIDKLLHSMYNKILYCAEQQEIKLPMHF
jgi:hypothetical protein